MKGMLPVAYAEFLKAIKERVRSAQISNNWLEKSA